MFKRKKIGVALSGGSAKGLAHIGVLKVLEQNKIPIDLIAGTSMGAVVGALYCSFGNANEIEKIFQKIEWKKLVDLTIPKQGLLKGEKIENLLKDIICNKKFSELKIPLYVSVVDLNKNQEIIFHKGNVAKAVRASISLPGIFRPVVNNGRILVDGGLINPLPIEALKKAGAEIIIAVNVNSLKKGYVSYDKASDNFDNFKMPLITEVLMKSFQITESRKVDVTLEKFKPDILIEPDLKNLNATDFLKYNQFIKQGEQAARKEIIKIKKQKSHDFFSDLILGNLGTRQLKEIRKYGKKKDIEKNISDLRDLIK